MGRVGQTTEISLKRFCNNFYPLDWTDLHIEFLEMVKFL